MIRFVIIFIVLFSIIETAFSSETDSLEKALEITKNSRARVDVLNELAKSYSNVLPDKGLFYGKQALKLARSLKYMKGVGTALKNSGINYWRKADYPHALECYFEGVTYFQKCGDLVGLAYTYNNIGLVYYAQNDYDISLFYYNKSLKLHEIKGNDAGIARALLNMGLVCDDKKMYDSALAYQYQSLEYSEKTNDSENIANSLNYLATTYIKKKQYDRANELLIKSLGIFKSIKNTYGIAEVGDKIADCYYDRGDYRNAIKYAGQSYDTAKAIGAKFLEFEAANMLSKIYEKTTDYKKAYFYKSIYSRLIEEIYTKEKEDKIKDYQAKAELELQEEKERKEEEEIRLANYKNKFINITYLVVITFILSFAGLLGYNYKKKKHYSKELEAKNQAINDMLNELKYSYEEIKNQKAALENLNNELKEANSTKDKFFSIIAHDLKGPAGSFMNVSVLLNDSYDDLGKEDIRDIISSLKEYSIHLSDFINNLLTWARTQSGKIKFLPESFSLRFVINDIVHLLDLPAREKLIKLHVDVPEEAVVMADINMIHSVLRNLVSNAIKFTPDGGDIYIEAKPGDGFLRLSVRDTGVGMSEDELRKLFSIGAHFTNPGTRQEKGTGLGLILCKDFVEKHSINGETCRMSVKSRPGEGTTFSFNVPIADGLNVN